MAPPKSTVYEEVIKHKGYFNYSELYNFCYRWLKDEQYLVREEKYSEKITSGGKEIEIKWSAFKKVTDYFRNNITIKWHIITMTDAEIEVNGKKEKTNKGDLKLTFTAELERDYEQKWEENPTYKFLRGVYDKYVLKTMIDQYEDRLWDKTESFVENTKAFLMLEGKK
jgi:hypothetical protein